MSDLAIASLLGALAGDCLGAPWEGAPTADAFTTGPERRRRALEAAQLRHTDDAQLTFALATHLVHDDADVDPPRLAERILEVFEPWRGYGGGMRRLVARWEAGDDLDRAAAELFDGGSYGNGAAMRIAPVGLRWRRDDDRRRRAARRSATLTHAHPLGWTAAVLQADAVAVAAREGTFGAVQVQRIADTTDQPQLAAAASTVVALLDAPPASPREVVDRLGVDVTAPRSVPTAWWVAAAALGDDDPLVGAIDRALALGGDADTIACMAGAIVGAAAGVAPPAQWQQRLEGAALARELAARLG